MNRRRHIERLLPELKAYAYSISDRREDGDDLVQDAVARALRADSPPRRLGEFRPWMFRTIRNLNIDELRKRRVRREYLERETRLSGEISDDPKHERDMHVRAAFATLSSEMREILTLIDILGLKYDEAARVIDVPRGTVMSRISRARRGLRDRIIGVESIKRRTP
ncbi:MAG: RNA polymerase sigma factor [Sulfitobacter litoralis]|jgi:RNA polymerase sigma-70 factor (ECF subfamily)|nr:RNA polymerase sigma factor [Sulfitobacter litoralis]